MNYSNLPEDLINNYRFCLWGNKRVIPRNKREEQEQKIPVNPLTGENASSNNIKDTFSDYNTALNALNEHSDIYKGLGVALEKTLCCIDLDHCLSDRYSKEYERALYISELFDSYTEKSQSGEGLHIFFYADLTKVFNQKELQEYNDTYYLKNSELGIEFYSPQVTNRYIAITGNIIKNKCEIKDHTDKVKDFVNTFLLRPVKLKRNKISQTVKKYQSKIQEMGKDKLLQKIFDNPKNGKKFRDIYNNNWEEYYIPKGKSHSEARWYLLHQLAFWTALNRELMCEILMDSEFYIQSDKMLNRPQLVQDEITKAVNEQIEYYKPKVNDTKNIFLKFLDNEGISAKFNILSNEVEYIHPDCEDYTMINKENNLATAIKNRFNDVYGNEFGKISKNEVNDQLNLIANKNYYSPVRDYLTSTEWDGKERFQLIYQILGVTDKLNQNLIRKWFYQTAMLAFSDLDNLRYTEGVLILQGPESIGKSTFFRKITPYQNWYKLLDQTLNIDNKDNISSIISHWIVEIGEIDRSFTADRSDFKGFVTNVKDEVRLPYDRAFTKKARMTSICGTTNNTQFLNDNAGWRRWWCVEIERIDQKLLNELCDNKENLKQFWAQVYHEATTLELLAGKDRIYSLTDEEKNALRERNLQRRHLLYGEDELMTCFDWTAPVDKWKQLTATEIVRALPPEVGNKLNSRTLGRTLQDMVNRKLLQPQKKGRKYLFPPVKF